MELTQKSKNNKRNKKETIQKCIKIDVTVLLCIAVYTEIISEDFIVCVLDARFMPLMSEPIALGEKCLAQWSQHGSGFEHATTGVRGVRNHYRHQMFRELARVLFSTQKVAILTGVQGCVRG